MPVLLFLIEVNRVSNNTEDLARYMGQERWLEAKKEAFEEVTDHLADWIAIVERKLRTNQVRILDVQASIQSQSEESHNDETV